MFDDALVDGRKLAMTWVGLQKEKLG